MVNLKFYNLGETMEIQQSLTKKLLHILYFHVFRRSLVPLFLIAVCPLMVILVWYTCAELGGSFQNLGKLCISMGTFNAIQMIWGPVFFGSLTAWKVVGAFAAFQLLLMKVVPGKTFKGPVTPEGNVPIYKANGIASFLITMLSFYLCSFKFGLFSPTIIYDNFGAILGGLSFFSLALCLVLYIKGRFYPSSSDNGVTGNIIFDYYWGTELYPRIAGWDVKMFTNCRFGMMGWGLILLSYAAKQHQVYGISDSMLVCVSLQLIYISKFFLWETGYLRSLDIMHDRAGFYICWGCLVWLPCIYTSPALYLVHNPVDLGIVLSSTLFLLGILGITINYLADRQRQKVREFNGNCKIWGKKPEITRVSYRTEKGEVKESILLSSGWWGIARHFHYIPEILGALFWSMPALFSNFMPYFYVCFLTILLMDRAFRDDKRCAQKYGSGWDEYSKKVPYKILPYIL